MVYSTKDYTKEIRFLTVGKELGMEPEKAAKRVEVFYSYHYRDEKLRQGIEKHLSSFKQKKLINTWSFGMLHPGVERLKAINVHFNAADIILLLVSPDFLHSDYCCEV